MGLDTSHGCWNGAYSAFMRWRTEIAKCAGINLHEMDGFITNGKSWEPYKDDVLTELLYHSDCDGDLDWKICDKLADRLEELLPLLPTAVAGGHIGSWHEKTKTFITGLREAFNAKENVDFH